MDDINDDVLKVNCENGDSGSRRCWLSRDESHWLDTINVSNSSSRNWNSWFVAMIASLNIVANTFAGLSTMIIARRTRHVLILHLEAKYVKMDCKNEIYTRKLGKEHLDCKKSTVNSTERSTVNAAKSQRSTIVQVNWRWCQQLADDVSRWVS